MDNNYFNPGSMRPQGQSLMDMYFYPQQMQNYMDVQQVARQQQEDALRKHILETNSYERDAPVRESGRRKDISANDLETLVNRISADTPGYGAAMAGGKMGDANTREAAGRTAMGTYQGNIDTTNLGNTIKQLEGGVRQLELVGGLSPMMADAQWKQTWQNLPEPLKRQLPSYYSPELGKRIQAMSQALTQTPAHRGEMEKTNATNASQERVGQGNNAATVQAAGIRANAKVSNLIQTYRSAKTPQMALIYGQMILNDPEVDDNVKAQVRVGVEQAARVLAQQNFKGSIDLSNPTGGPAGMEQDAVQRLLGVQPNQVTLGQLKRLYPGKSDQWLRDAYKRKYGVDIK